MRTSLPFCLSLFVGLSSPTSLTAQGWQWSRHFGGPGHDRGHIGVVDAAGNVYSFGGYAGSSPGVYHDLYIDNDTLRGSKASFITKHDVNGNLLWVKNLVCNNDNYSVGVSSMVMALDSTGLAFTGAHSAACLIGTIALSDSGAFLAKMDLDGTCSWAVNIGGAGTGGTGLARNEVGELFACGVVSGTSSSIGNVSVPAGSFIAKFTSAGTQIWAKSLITGVSSSGTHRYFPLTARYLDGTVYILGNSFQYASGEPLIADTVHSSGVNGTGSVLLAVDGTTGVSKWMALMGFPIGDSFASDGMDIGMNNQIYCSGTTYGDSAFFGQDTAISALPSTGNSYLAIYSASGQLLHLRATGRESLYTAINAPHDGSVLLLGVVNSVDPVVVNSCSVGQGLFLMRMDSLGNCMDLIQTGYAYGMNVVQTPLGIYMAATTPGPPQFNTTTFAGESVTSYGFEDVLLAKLDLSLGVQSLALDENDGLHIYANPNQGSFQVQVPDALVNAPHLDLKIYDATGRLVLAQPIGSGDEHPQFDLYGIGAGFYAVTLSNGQRVYHGNMVVE